MKILKKVSALTLVFLQAAFCILSVNAAGSDETLAVKADELVFKARDNCVIEEGGSESFAVELGESGEYEINLLFRPTADAVKKSEYSVKIDGEYPFAGAEQLTADVIYDDDGGVITLKNGDQTIAAQKQADGIMKCAAYDTTGVRLTPYTVSLTAGRHIFNVECIMNRFEFYGISLTKPEKVDSYSEVSKGYNFKNYSGDPIIAEAEDVLYRSDYSLTAKSDNGSSAVSPRSVKKTVINYIGSSVWSSPGQELAWEIDIPEDGLYNLGFSFKQNTVMNGKAFRWLKIDGETPFAEMSAIGFDYKTAWQYKELTDENGEKYLFSLTKGKHTISLAVTLADVSAVYDTLNGICTDIGDLYLDIVMITGESPDSNRDYELYKQIPDYEEKLGEFYSKLTELSDSLKENKNINGQLDGAVKNMARISKLMADNRYDSHLYLKTYYSYYQTLSSWLFDIKNMALSLDKIVLSAPGKDAETGTPGFFGKISFGFARFFKSFTDDYIVKSNENGKSIKIWVNWGRDQVKVLNTLIQESFTAKTGISVNLEQVNATLIQGVISNNSPDLFLNLARTEPVNLAMRGVLLDLSSFEDYGEVIKQFMPGAETPYIYRGKCYALPDTQNFNIMFVRDDILKQLDLSAPETWDDFIQATAVIQRKNMNTYLPYVKITSSTTVNTGVGGLTLFPTMLLQSGESIYNSELNKTNMSNASQVAVFKKWTDFYTKYSLNPDINFYQRFRVGTVPIGVAGYANYQTFAAAAPEIAGRWSIHLIPGTKDENGSINHAGAGSGTGCAIMKSSKNQDAAWEFLKWWVSEDTQYSYSSGVEAVLGTTGRITTSNVAALKRLSWYSKDLQAIIKQWECVEEIPEVPGSYYVSRSVDQAFWAVKNGGEDEKKAITKWAKISDNEIERKISEYADKNFD